MNRRALEWSRRQFLQRAGAVGASISFSGSVSGLVPRDVQEEVGRTGKKVTLLEDGGFAAGGWGWQFTKGAQIVEGAGRRVGSGAVHVATESGDYARFFVLGPEVGKTYTVVGWMKTKGVTSSTKEGGAYFAASQFEFQGRPTEFTVDGKQAVEARYGNVTGTQDWMRFEHSFKCLATTAWFEVVLGIFRESGKAWFSDVTFVEGDAGADFADVVTPWQALGIRHRALIAGQAGSRPRAAILRDSFPVVGIASDPARMAALLMHEYEIELLDAHQLADASFFRRMRFDLLVLPCGESFPLAAKGSVMAFLADGGDLLTTGGYAFRAPVVQHARDAWELNERAVAMESGENLLADFTGVGWKRSQGERTGTGRDNIPGLGDIATAFVTIETHVWEQTADWTFDVPASGEGEQYHVSGWLAVEDAMPAPEGCALIGVEQLEASGELAYAARVTFEEIRGSKAWHRVERTFYLVPTCKTLRVRFGLRHATGKVKAAGLRLERRSPQVRMNTAFGWPEDSLTVDEHQIGLFDADYRLKRATRLRANDGTMATGSFEGYAASGVVGTNHARWRPLLEAQDDAGRRRGAAGAMMMHSAGPYARGAWGFFGVDNVDLFAGGTIAAERALQEFTGVLRHKCFVHAVETSFACYRDGEPVMMRALVSNFGREVAEISVRWSVTAVGAPAAEFRKSETMRIDVGETVAASAVWRAARFEGDHYRVGVELVLEGKRIDEIESGFNVWRSATLHQGMPLSFRDNYFQVGGRSVFLQGTDDYLHTFIDQDENAGTWLADAQGCRDSCIDVYENLMGLRGPQHRPTEAWWRWIDAMLLNTQSVGGVFFPGMLVFSNTAVSDVDLADQKAYVKAFAGRYREAAAVMYYLNGDLELHDPNLPDLQRLYNDFLRSKYGTDAALREAWKITPPEGSIGSLAIKRGSANFADVRTFDDFQFRTQVVRRWLNAMHDSIREVDMVHPVTAEFYQSPVSGIDLLTAMGKLELANFGYFNEKEEDFYRFPQTCRFLDQSMRGKGINVGEFGVKTHPAWNDTGYYIEARTEAYEQSYFLSLAHYGFALGASKIQNWCWKYPADLPFEWGINYPNELVPRDVRAFYRNSGLLFRGLRPRYETPEAVVLLASDSRMGGQGHRIVEGQLNAIRLLLDQRVRFGTLTDEFLAELPSTVRTIFYPLPYCPSDEIVAALSNFVERGGQLYVSGDISYDSARGRTRFDRLRRLCGVEVVKERFTDIDYVRGAVETAPLDAGWPRYWAAPGLDVRLAGATMLLGSAGGMPIVTSYRLGEGFVVFSADPIELHGDPRYQTYAHTFYGSLLRVLGLEEMAIEPEAGALHCFRVPSQDEREITVVVNHGDEAIEDVGLEGIHMRLGPRLPGVVVQERGGSLLAVESSGNVRERGRLVITSNVHTMVIAMDGKTLTSCSRMLVLPMGTGSFALHRTQAMQRPALLVGEMADGRWRELRRSLPQQEGGTIVLPISSVESLGMLLLCEEGGEAAAIAEVETLVKTPWRLEQ